MQNLLNNLFDILGMNASNGLANDEALQSMTPYQRLFYNQVKEKLNIDAVYFLRDEQGIAKIPLIYFSLLDQYDAKEVAKLHKLSWNMGEAPLLFVVCPDAIKVFNNYSLPTIKDDELDSNAGLIQTIKIINGIEEQRDALLEYHRTQLETGEYWSKAKVRFNTKNRVDITLMSNLKYMRKTLISRISKRNVADAKTIKLVVHGLLCRSILIKYLEERKDSNGKSVFPSNFFTLFAEGAQKYTDLLVDKKATYTFFDCLKEKFNGDLMQISEQEFDIISQEDLNWLKAFLLGEAVLESGQLTLWRLYSFDIIPIQLISSIYELFFHLSDADDEKGTYYTPLHLVELMLDEIYPWEGEYSPKTFFDPSCGSGIFLVEAFRRLVCRWMNTNHTDKINSDELKSILNECIFGVDISEDAIRIAAFSLSLAMCDFLDPRSIWDQLSFPRLIGTNLIVGDFFDTSLEFNNLKYDFIIGNPPWQSKITELTKEYIDYKNRTIGDKQIAQAFTIKCSDLCKKEGLVCLLMPSKGLLFNRSQTSSKYRQELFSNNIVYTIINLSVYRRNLFDHACGPAAVIIYSPTNNSDEQRHAANYQIVYCTPKPRFNIEDDKKFSIDPTDICKLPNDLIHNDLIWKIAMWGNPRDLELIEKIQYTFPSFEKFIEDNNMVSAEGFKRGNRKNYCNDFIDMPIIDAKSFPNSSSNLLSLDKVDFTDFECIVSNKREIFKTPHLLIKQSHRNGKFLSIVLDFDAVFNHSILGVHGDENKLKYLSLIIGSRVFSFYHILTNRKWLIERDELEAGDIWNTPIPVPSKEELAEATILYDNYAFTESNQNVVEQFVRKMYRLYDYEGYQIDDVIEYTFDYFQMRNRSKSFNAAREENYKIYYETLINTLNNTLEQEIIFEGKLHIGHCPLVALEIIIGSNSNKLSTIKDDSSLEELLFKLDNSLQENRNNIFVRRNLRIYQNDRLYIIKPNHRKYWTFSIACRDADDIFRDIVEATEDN